MEWEELRPRSGTQQSFYGKAHYTYSNDGQVVYLKSYTQIVAVYVRATRKLYRTWDGYSATTLRHVNAFLAECNARTDWMEHTAPRTVGPLSKRDWLALTPHAVEDINYAMDTSIPTDPVISYEVRMTDNHNGHSLLEDIFDNRTDANAACDELCDTAPHGTSYYVREVII